MEDQAAYYSGALPLDSSGFTVSFDINHFDQQQALKFFKEYGVVVFDNILNKTEIAESINDLWNQVESYSIDRNDMGTWDYFQQQPYLHYYGFVGKKPLDHPQIWKNRTNSLLYTAFKKMYELTSGETLKEPLLALFDRGSILRPSKLHPEWKIQPLPHFDINPWWWTKVKEVPEHTWRNQNEYGCRFQSWLGEGCFVPKVRNFTKLQGVLAFSDTTQESGGFEAVCGFHNHIQRWAKNTPYDTYIGDCQDLLAHMQKIRQRAGSLLIFSREIPHGVYPNISEKTVRYAQYVRMAPESTLMLSPQQKQARRQQVMEMVPGWILNSADPICQEIYMLK